MWLLNPLALSVSTMNSALLDFRMHCGEQLSFNCQSCSLFSHHPFFIKAGAAFCCTICFQASCQLWEVIILALKLRMLLLVLLIMILIKTESCLEFNTPLKFSILEKYSITFPYAKHYYLTCMSLYDATIKTGSVVVSFVLCLQASVWTSVFYRK